MTDRPRYYQPLEIPAYCVIWEAVLWVAFGRFPDGAGYEDTEELNEELGMLSFAWKDSFGGPRYRFRGFWWFETEMAGIDPELVDWDRYEAALRSGYQRLDALQEQVKMLEKAPPEVPPTLPHLVDRNKLYYELCRKELDEAPFVEGVHRHFQHQIDRGWSRIFQALVDGTLQGYGWGDLTQNEIREQFRQRTYTNCDDDGEGNVINPWHARLPEADTVGPLLPMGAMMEIPQKEWSLGGVAPDGRYVTATGRNWWDVCFSCEQLFALFPRPLLATEVVERDAIEIINPGLAIGAAGSSTPHHVRHLNPTPARGRKKLADGEIERACQSLYGRRLAAGEKEVALAEEAANFAMEVWGQKLGRSTFQEYMRPFKRPAVPEIMPENVAE